MVNSDHFDPLYLDMIFPHIEKFISLQLAFVRKLNSSIKNYIYENFTDNLLEFVQSEQGEVMKLMFGLYCNSQSLITKRHKELLKEDSKSATMFKEIEEHPSLKRMDFKDIFANVYQRPTKYPMFMEGIMKSMITDADKEGIEKLKICKDYFMDLVSYVNKIIDDRFKYMSMMDINCRIEWTKMESNHLELFKNFNIDEQNLFFDTTVTYHKDKKQNFAVYLMIFSSHLLALKKLEGNSFQVLIVDDRVALCPLSLLHITHFSDKMNGFVILEKGTTPRMMKFSTKNDSEKKICMEKISEAVEASNNGINSKPMLLRDIYTIEQLEKTFEFLSGKVSERILRKRNVSRKMASQRKHINSNVGMKSQRNVNYVKPEVTRNYSEVLVQDTLDPCLNNTSNYSKSSNPNTGSKSILSPSTAVRGTQRRTKFISTKRSCRGSLHQSSANTSTRHSIQNYYVSNNSSIESSSSPTDVQYLSSDQPTPKMLDNIIPESLNLSQSNKILSQKEVVVEEAEKFINFVDKLDENENQFPMDTINVTNENEDKPKIDTPEVNCENEDELAVDTSEVNSNNVEESATYFPRVSIDKEQKIKEDVNLNSVYSQILDNIRRQSASTLKVENINEPVSILKTPQKEIKDEEMKSDQKLLNEQKIENAQNTKKRISIKKIVLKAYRKQISNNNIENILSDDLVKTVSSDSINNLNSDMNDEEINVSTKSRNSLGELSKRNSLSSICEISQVDSEITDENLQEYNLKYNSEDLLSETSNASLDEVKPEILYKSSGTKGISKRGRSFIGFFKKTSQN